MTLPGHLTHGSRRVLLKYHRLLSGTGAHPPNSLSALRELLDGGAEAIELDVHRIIGGDYLLVHDETLDRETTGTGPVGACTSATAKQLRLRGWDEPPALLSEVTRILAEHKRAVKLQIDFKDQMPQSADEIKAFLNAIEPLRANSSLSIVVGCLGDWNLRTMRRLDSRIALGLDFLLYLDVPMPEEFPRLPLRENVWGYLDDHPLGYIRLVPRQRARGGRGRPPEFVRDYLQDRIETLCGLVRNPVEVYLRVEFMLQAFGHGVNPADVVRRTLGNVLIDAWTLNEDNHNLPEIMGALSEMGVDQITTDTAVQLGTMYKAKKNAAAPARGRRPHGMA